MEIYFTPIDTACVLLEINGFNILTDPTLDPPGRWYHHGWGSFSRKTAAPAVPAAQLPPIHAILLSHHQHHDNFDSAGRALAATVPTIISTTSAAKALPGVIGLSPWATHHIPTPLVPNLRITATPAQHHPWWLPGFFSGPVIGFVIEYDGGKPIYISGDTVYFNGIDAVAAKFQIDIGIFHVGSAQFPYLTGPGRYTMNSEDLLKAAAVLQPNRIIPIHHRGWSHFKETSQHLKNTLLEHPETRDKTWLLEPGERVRLRE